MNTTNISVQPSLIPLPGCPRPTGIGLLPILILVYCCLCLYPGCLPLLPIPQGFRNIERVGKKIDKFRLNFVVPGETTKAEFIEKIGEPYLILDDLKVMAYYWKMLDAYVPLVTYGNVGILEMQSQYLLLVSYDDQGVINRYEIIRKRQTDSPLFPPKPVYERAAEWAAKQHSVGRKFVLDDPPAD